MACVLTFSLHESDFGFILSCYETCRLAVQTCGCIYRVADLSYSAGCPSLSALHVSRSSKEARQALTSWLQRDLRCSLAWPVSGCRVRVAERCKFRVRALKSGARVEATHTYRHMHTCVETDALRYSTSTHLNSCEGSSGVAILSLSCLMHSIQIAFNSLEAGQ